MSGASQALELQHRAAELDEVVVDELVAIDAFQATERLANITVPVRMLLGTQSPGYLRAATATVAAQIPGTTIVALQGQGHQAIDYDPQQFVRAVIDFDTH